MVAPTLIPDGTTNFSGGQNAGVKPHALAENQFYIGVNVNCSSTVLNPRWGIEEIPHLNFEEAGDFTRQTGRTVPFENVFKYGNFQGLIPYVINNETYVIYIIAGFLFLVNLDTNLVTVMNPTDMLNPNTTRHNWSNAGQYTEVFDWPNYPMILDGLTARRSDPSLYETPVSVLGCYNQNRLCIASAGIEWTAGDPAGSLAAPEAPVTFLEVLLPGSPYYGDIYQVPTSSKYIRSITAMTYLQVIDKSTGIGPLLVSTQDSIYSYRTDLPRAQWQPSATSGVFGSMFLPSTGIAGQRAHANVGSDVLFLGTDGQIYALSMARNDQRRWGNSPISREVSNFIMYPNKDSAYVSTVTYFKNKLFASCVPTLVDAITAEGYPTFDYVNSGMLVMDYGVNAQLNNPGVPIWTGLWTGVQFTECVEVNGTLYVSGKIHGENRLLKFNPNSTVDIIDGKERLIRSVIETKEYDHTDATVNKQLHSIDFGIRNIDGNMTISVDYRPSNVEYFTPWESVDFAAPVLQCSYPVKYPNGLVGQGIRDFTIGSTDESTCVPGTEDLMYVYKGVQIRATITARHWELEYIKVKGRVLPRDERETVCELTSGEPAPAECFNYFYIPE